MQNYDNEILNTVLKNLIPRIYSDIVGNTANRENLLNSSYKLQRKLSNSKSDFANDLLYYISIKEETDELPILPNYIQNALEWLKNKLKPIEETQEAEV